MKNYLSALLLLLPLFVLGQSHTTHSFVHGGQTRQYMRYVPASYNNTQPTPVVIALHGMGDNMSNFTGIGLDWIADTATFIVVTPQALVDQLVNATAWNSGASAFNITLNGNVDDLGFLEALIDTLDASYNIDQRRIYACGFSMGGFMSQRLACALNHRIAAVASVAGTIGNNLNCTPGRAVPVCHFHGTADGTVSYTGNTFGTDAEATVQFWATNNNCAGSPVVTPLPNTAQDGYTVDHWEWSGCDPGSGVEFYKVTGADHTWLGPQNDIFYTEEIWKFFRQYLLPANLVNTEAPTAAEFKVYPNPAASAVHVSFEAQAPGAATLSLRDMTGRLVQARSVAVTTGRQDLELAVAELATGMYVMEVQADGMLLRERLMVRR